jgi:hypothetical protein
MNYDDLINTNTFISGTDNVHDINYVENFKRYNKNVSKYRNKSLDTKNDDRLEDVIDEQKVDNSHTRYTKHIISGISIDSRDRDIGRYLKPNKYEIFLDKEYENIVKIQLKSINMPNAIQPVNIQNNRLKWKCREYLDFIADFQLPLANYKEGNFESATTTYNCTIPPGYYSTEGIALRIRERMNETPSIDNTPQFFYIDIDTDEHITTMISRYEEIKIESMRIIKGDSYLAITPLDPDGIIDANWTGLSVVVTDLPEIGGIPKTLINAKEFNNNVIFANGELTIDLGIFAPYSETIENMSSTKARVGRSRFFALRHLGVGNDDDTTTDGVINTVLGILGFPVPKGNITVVSEKLPARPVHRNTDYLIEDYIRLATVAGTDITFFNTSVHVLDIELGGDGKYYFRSEPYIFLRMTIPKGKTGEIGGNIVPSLSNSGSVERRNLYYDNPFQATLQNETNRILKDIGNIFAKIYLNPIPGNMLYNTFTESIKIFYNTPLRRFGSMIVEFVDSKGKLLDLRNEHSFVISITEEIDILENSLVNSRIGDKSTAGIYIEGK